MDFIRRTDSSLALQEKIAKEKEELLENVKREAKRLMEEAVTRRFVHADSSSVSSLCAAVDACLSHRLKKRVGGLLSSNSTDSLINKFAKYDEDAGEIAKQCHDVQDTVSRTSSFSDNQKNMTKVNGYNVSGHYGKHMWIRLALLERVLAKIIGTLIEHKDEFYENDAFLSDQVDGPSLVWLLDGPCSLDYSKMKTPEASWTDPPADELVLRHRIYGGTSSSSSSPQLNKPQLFVSQVSEPISSAPQLAREHVDSLHQNAHSSLMFGKNNVVIDMPELEKPVAGYLSIHKCSESLLLKWTPNPMMSGESGTEKSQYWNRVLTVDMSDIVFLHCHQSGDQNGTVVLIGQDGLQLPPLSFPSGSLLPFLTCLEQGLGPQGRFDPPLSNTHIHPGSQNKRNILTEKIAKLGEEQDSNASQDFVFRLINGVKTSAVACLARVVSWFAFVVAIFMAHESGEKQRPTKRRHVQGMLDETDSLKDKSRVGKIIVKKQPYQLQNTSHKKQLQRLLSNATPSKILPIWKQKEEKRKNLLPKMHNVKLQRNGGVPARVSVQLAYDKMKHQIVSRAFHGWIAHRRYLKTVRTHLASLVLPAQSVTRIPADIENGITEEVFQKLSASGQIDDMMVLMQYVYLGGVTPSMRHKVWPYLLGHFLFGSTADDLAQIDARNREDYQKVLKDCKTLEVHLREKEKDLLNIEGFGDADSLRSDVTDGELRDVVVQEKPSSDGSLSDSHSEGNTLGGTREDSFGSSSDSASNVVQEKPEWKGNSLISTLIDTKQNLREMVDNASKRGAEAWKNLIKKSKSKQNRRRTESEPTSPPSDISSLLSFDLEISCNTCGKKIIESRQRVMDGRLHENSMDTIECLMCAQSHENNGNDPEQWTLRYPKPLERTRSCTETSHESRHRFDEGKRDTIDGPGFLILNGEDLDNRKPPTASVEMAYGEDQIRELALNIHRIDKDVLRCDRNHPYFVHSENLDKLRNVVMSYVWERLEVGYVQGMCDLCAPFLIIFDDEAKAYGCFVKLMDRMEPNFPHGTAMDSHLANIQALIQILDPELYEVLYQDSDSSIFYFCYRWLLLDFKREVQYEDVFIIWETIWAATFVSAPNFSLFVAVAIIELYREIIIDNNMDFTDIIKFFNEMAERHDAKAVLNLARNIVRKLQEIMHPSDQN